MKKPKVDTPYEGSWAHQEQARPRQPITPAQEQQRRSGVLIEGVTLYACNHKGERISDVDSPGR